MKLVRVCFIDLKGLFPETHELLASLSECMFLSIENCYPTVYSQNYLSIYQCFYTSYDLVCSLEMVVVMVIHIFFMRNNPRNPELNILTCLHDFW